MSDHRERAAHVSSRRRSPMHISSKQRDSKDVVSVDRGNELPLTSRSKRKDVPYDVKKTTSPTIKSVSNRGRRSRSPSLRGDSSGHTTDSSTSDVHKSKRAAVGDVREVHHVNGLSSPSHAKFELTPNNSDSKQRSPYKQSPALVHGPRPSLPDYLPAVQGCRTVREFKVLNKIEEGTYGIVFRACETRTGEIIALKRLKMEREKDGFPITSLREVSCLLKAQHRNIVRVREIVVGDNMEQIFMVMDFVEHDLKTLMNSMTEPFRVGEVKTLMRQLLGAVAYLHDNWIIHRDLKTSNLLLSNKGVLKVADFGLAREYGSPIKPYTSVVVTLWYRAPELILGIPKYSSPIDIWSCGCIFAELLTLEPLFPGKTELDELMLIYKLLGTPNEKLWPGYHDLPLAKKVTFATFPISNVRHKFANLLTPLGIAFLNKFLIYDPARRITAAEALDAAMQCADDTPGGSDGYFYESPSLVPEDTFPTWPAKSELAPSAAQRALAAKKQHVPRAPEGANAFRDKDKPDADEKKWVTKFGVKVPAHAAKQADAGFTLKF